MVLQRAQRLAAAAVRRVVAGRSLGTVLAEVWAAERVSAQERPLVQELAYGTLRHLGYLRAVVRELAARAPDPEVEGLLWVALYQLEHTRAAAHAVVDQAVEACAPLERKPAAGFVNAILRRYLRQRESVRAAAQSTPEGRWSYPSWWIDRLRSEYPGAWESILAAGNARPPLTLRVNRLRVRRDEYLSSLGSAAFGARAVGEDGVIVDPPLPVSELPGFAEGLFSVQDLGAQLAAPLLDVQGVRVLDACAAPGGKTTHLAECGAGSILAVDDDPARIERIRDNLARLRLAADVVRGDASRPSDWWDGAPFERILADVPCTASGVVRRHPDIKWLRRERDIAGFAAQQARILDALWSCLAVNGRMLYVTCSLFRAENEEQIAAFLDRHADALRAPIDLPAHAGVRGGQLLPGDWGPAHNHDGFFYALVRKR
jgi:16S rRNA (cytosine967-C5)-methyltransferase